MPSRFLHGECPVFRLRLHTQLQGVTSQKPVSSILSAPQVGQSYKQTDSLTNQLTNSRDQRPSCSWDSQVIPLVFWNPKVHRRVHKSQPATYPEPDQTSHIPWRQIFTLSCHLLLGFPSDVLSSGFPIKPLYAPLLFFIRVTCSVRLTSLDLMTRIIIKWQKI